MASLPKPIVMHNLVLKAQNLSAYFLHIVSNKLGKVEGCQCQSWYGQYPPF